MPAVFSSAWMNCAERSATVPVGTIRWTVGFETPACCTSFFACVGLKPVHLTEGSYHALEGETGVQPGSTVPPKTTLFIALRSIAISNALRQAACAAIAVPTF